jgi:hypothetical protein
MIDNKKERAAIERSVKTFGTSAPKPYFCTPK